MRPLKEKISITIDNDVLEVLREEAEKDERSLSQYINLILRQHIKTINEKKQDDH
ncbi:MAG: toxin-antitoxin system protein [Clostridia bacterium]|nr:toxin-antitoxin system protein [Clostridia bacterium]